jgi:4a-hydroxytetrahydrobiopterin dehydratase
MEMLSEEALRAAVASMRGWTVGDGELVKTYSFSTFPDAIAFVNRVADLAEDVGHHPDIDIRYSSVTMHLSTHSAGGIMQMDLDLARRIDALLSR